MVDIAFNVFQVAVIVWMVAALRRARADNNESTRRSEAALNLLWTRINRMEQGMSPTTTTTCLEGARERGEP